MKINEVIQQPEGRRLEFKQELPTVADLCKTIVAFANDAGGEIFIGISNEPRAVVGIPEDNLFKIEEQISNLIHDNCQPVIIPDISFHGDGDVRFIRVKIFRGSNFPYYLKSKGKTGGTFVRVGSSNRLADLEIIEELERQKRNVSFDSELVHEKPVSKFNIESFKLFFKEKTEEELSEMTLKKTGLLAEFQGDWLPTNSYLLFSDFSSRKEFFPYSKIECARFKGSDTDVFIDQKTIDDHIGIQAEKAYDFVLRHINKGATVKGVYTEGHWEYPIKAIREVLRNAVVHRDYSLIGKDIKVAIFDDMVEITSPGKLRPSIDFNELEARQSDIRNKIIAPIFKKIGVIDQWGNGLKLIAEELKKYPEVEFLWFEKGLSLQLQFIKRGTKIIRSEGDDSIENEIGTKLALSRHQVGTKSTSSWHQVEKLLSFTENQKAITEMMVLLEWKDRSKFREKYVLPLLETGILKMTNPDKPQSSKQQYFLSPKGLILLNTLRTRHE
jgi:ATP-dependent DNA helicase RecG